MKKIALIALVALAACAAPTAPVVAKKVVKDQAPVCRTGYILATRDGVSECVPE